MVQNDIRKNPAFRSQFHEMCAKVGVDPLASNKGFWAELLGIGDFYYELGVYCLCWSFIVCLINVKCLMSQMCWLILKFFRWNLNKYARRKWVRESICGFFVLHEEIRLRTWIEKEIGGGGGGLLNLEIDNDLQLPVCATVNFRCAIPSHYWDLVYSLVCLSCVSLV